MKKSLILVLVIALTLVLAAGCTTTEDNTIKMGTASGFEPFEYVEGGVVAGFDIDIAKVIAEKLGKELQIEDMDFGGLITAVSAGNVDFAIAGMSVTDERKESVDFSNPYFMSTQVIIVNNGSEITSADALTGKKVGVQLGTTGEMFAADIENVDLQSFNQGVGAVQDLLAGNIDAVILDEQPAKRFVKENADLAILDEVFANEEYAIAIPKGNEELVKEINEVLAEIKSNGKYDELYSKYFTITE